MCPLDMQIFDASEQGPWHLSVARRNSLLREVLLLAALNGHPHIVKFKEAFVGSDHNIYVVTELLEGPTLADFLRWAQLRCVKLPMCVEHRLPCTQLCSVALFRS